MNLMNYKQNIYSQHGEDGMINHLLSLLPNEILDKICVEFGAWDGKYLSNTYRFVENLNYTGFYIEGDEQKYQDLLKTADEIKRIIPINAYVGWEVTNSLDYLLESNGLKNKNFDLLSIDVDGLDYKIWKNFLNYTPKIVIIETNSSLERNRIFTEEELTEELLIQRGVNYGTMNALAKEKGYTILAYTGNAIYLHNDYLKYVT